MWRKDNNRKIRNKNITREEQQQNTHNIKTNNINRETTQTTIKPEEIKTQRNKAWKAKVHQTPKKRQ